MGEESKICLFVGNLPYSVTDAELEAVFKCHGPLRSCYTVKHKGATKQSRGFGYVTYINREDAQKAKSRVKVIGSRPVQVCFAKRKCLGKLRGNPSQGGGSEEMEVMGGDEEVKEEEEEEEEEEEDYEALTARNQVQTKQHKAKSERSRPKFDVGRVAVFRSLPAEAKEKRLRKKCEEFGEVEEVIFPSESGPQMAHVVFSTHKAAHLAVKGLNGIRYKKSVDSVMEVQLLSQQNKKVSTKTLKKSRLIVRNLSFQCSEKDIKEVFEKFGPVLRVDIPKKENGYMRGYGFIQFSSYFDASKALAGVNGTEVKGRKVTVDWLLPKAEYQDKLGGSQGGVASAEDGGSEEGGSDDEEEEGGGSDEEEEEGGGSDEEEGGEEGGSGSEGEEEDGDAESEDGESDEEDRGSSGGEEEEGPMSELGSGANRVTDDVNEGRTVFIRNVPHDADRIALKKRMMRYGVVRYCRVMMNRETGQATGSAFVQFKTEAAARKCLVAADKQAENGVQFEGQRLTISLAVPKSEIERAHKEKSDRQEKEDKRNLYLAREGAIFPDSEAAKGLSKTDMAKRTKAYAEKKAKLANPNFYVSTTRLCVRNLSTSVDEKKLRALFQNTASSPDAKIVQIKILRSTERVDSKGVGRSTGYGFVEFSSHKDALSALRATNNNPAIFGKAKRPIVDFAVEDSRVMKIRAKRMLLRQQRIAAASDGTSTGGPAIAESAGSKRLTKRRKWQLKWQSRRQKRKETRSLQAGEQDTEASKGGRNERVNNKQARRVNRKSGTTSQPTDVRPKKIDIKERVKKITFQQESRKRKAEPTPTRPHKYPRKNGGHDKVLFSQQNRNRSHRTHSRSDVEEREFTNMVTKYHRRLGKH